MSDVPYGVLLSGGLDSSIISAVAKKYAAKRIETNGTADAWWPQLHSFAVGLKGAPDLAAARKVADHIGTVHHEINYTIDEGLDAIRDVIYFIETYDVTTVRASTPMYLLSRVIKSMDKEPITITVPFNITYTIYANGTVDVNTTFKTGDNFNMPRLGLQVALNPKLEQVEWYGRGPIENYWDRKDAAYVGLYNNTVTGMEESYVRAQSMFGQGGFIGAPNFGNLSFYHNSNGLPTEGFLIFETVFCGTSATIVSGSMAERTKFSMYVVYSFFISLIIYPVEGHWTWGGGWLMDATSGSFML